MSQSEENHRKHPDGSTKDTPIKDRTQPRENPPVDEERVEQARRAMAEISGH